MKQKGVMAENRKDIKVAKHSKQKPSICSADDGQSHQTSQSTPRSPLAALAIEANRSAHQQENDQNAVNYGSAEVAEAWCQ